MNHQFELTPRGGWVVPGGTEIPAGTVIPPFSVLGMGCIIGDGCTIGRETMIRAQCRVGNDCIIEHGCQLQYRSKLGARCQLHTMVSVHPRVKLGKDCVWLGVHVLDWVAMSNIDQTGRHIKIIKHAGGFIVEGGKYRGSDAEFLERADRNGDRKCAMIVRAVVEAMREFVPAARLPVES